MEKVLMSLKLHQKLRKYSKAHRSDYPVSFMIAKNKDGVLDTALQLKPDGDGCSEMSGFESRQLHSVYVKIAKKGKTPCGFARVKSQSGYFQNGWGCDAGEAASYVQFILTVSDGRFDLIDIDRNYCEIGIV